MTPSLIQAYYMTRALSRTARVTSFEADDTGDASNSYLVHDATNDRVSLYVDGIELVRINK